MPDWLDRIWLFDPVTWHDFPPEGSWPWLSDLSPLIPNQSVRLDNPCLTGDSFYAKGVSTMTSSVFDPGVTTPMRQNADRRRTSRRPALDDVRISRRVGVCGCVRVLSLPTTLLSTCSEAHSSYSGFLFSFLSLLHLLLKIIVNLRLVLLLILVPHSFIK